MRRLPTAAAITAVVALMIGVIGFVVSAMTSPVSAETSTTIINEGSPDGFVAVVKVSGLLDPVMVDFIRSSIDDAINEGALALILQTDSNGVVVDDATFEALLNAMLASPVPIDVWVGPSGSHLTGLPAQLVGAADQVGMAPGSRLGDAGQPVVSGLDAKRLAPITDKTVNAQEAADLGVTTVAAPTIGDFLVNLPGVATREVTADNGETRREPLTQVRFGQLSLVSNLMHTVASPAVAYLLITVGLALIIFELFTAGVGVAGVVGAAAFILSGYGMWVLPTHWWAFVLLGISIFAFAIDVQTGVPRVWTGIGMVLFVVFSFTVYDGMSMSWITLLVA
ncbi:MAG: hypothetical protein NT081_01015, partial [Actinobacteria bacterium]|nr:hypothetical protein [Actinomycetota bacterium]